MLAILENKLSPITGIKLLPDGVNCEFHLISGVELCPIWWRVLYNLQYVTKRLSLLL